MPLSVLLNLLQITQGILYIIDIKTKAYYTQFNCFFMFIELLGFISIPLMGA